LDGSSSAIKILSANLVPRFKELKSLLIASVMGIARFRWLWILDWSINRHSLIVVHPEGEVILIRPYRGCAKLASVVNIDSGATSAAVQVFLEVCS
jgi:hypothetical protein